MSPEPASDWEARAREAERRADEAWAAYHRLAAELDGYRVDSEKLAAIEGGKVWRMLAPLRIARDVWNQIRQFIPQSTKSLYK